MNVGRIALAATVAHAAGAAAKDASLLRPIGGFWHLNRSVGGVHSPNAPFGAVTFPDYSMSPARYFIITYRDSTFECLASELVAHVADGVRVGVFQAAARSMR